MASKLYLGLLGSLRITIDGALVGGLDSNKAKALLCYLAMTGHAQARSTLTGLLWGDMPEDRAKANLRVTLANVRKSLGSYLVVTRQTVAFNRDRPYELDVENFLARVQPSEAKPDVGSLQAAVYLYRGDLLAGFYVREAPDFEEWVLTQRERLRELALQALHTLATYFADRGPAGRTAAIDYTTRLLALAPWREEAHRGLMLLLARGGQYQAALAQFETCCRVLAEELGVGPMAATTALHERIRVLATGQYQPARLPPQPTAFVGREVELAYAGERLADPVCRLLTIVGPGGIGKTRLALEVASGHNGRFLEGVCFVPLAAVRSARMLAPAIANVLQFAFYGPGEAQTQLLNFLREKEMLLVLDSFEYLLAEVDLLAAVLRQAPGVKLLVTSRERLNLQGEWLVELDGLQFPENGRGDGRETYAAVELFLQSARRVKPNFVLSDWEEAGAVRICQLVQGLPLGIELAAAWVRVLSCVEIAAEVERNLDFLATTYRDMPKRHRSVRAVFDHSWQHLSDEERRVFRQLSVFRGGFRREAAETVVGTSLSTLSGLVDKSFLRRSAPGRYLRHALLWQYAAEKLAEFPDEKVHIHDLHGEYFAAFVRGREAYLRGGDQQQTALKEIAEEIENVRAGWQWAIQRKKQEAIEQNIAGLYLFFNMRGWFQEGEETFRIALEGLGLLPKAGEDLEGQMSAVFESKLGAQVLARYARFCQFLGHHPKAYELLKASLSVLDSSLSQAELQAAKSFSLNGLAHGATTLGQYDEAQEYLLESTAIAREIGDQYNLIDALNNLGMIADVRGEYERALELYEECLVLKRQVNDKAGIARALHNLADTFRLRGEYRRATELGLEALGLAREIGDRRLVAYALNNLGEIAQALEDYEAAKRYQHESLGIFKELGEIWGLAMVLTGLGTLSRAVGETQEARRYLQEALEKSSAIRAYPQALGALFELGALLVAEAEYSPNPLETKAQALSYFWLILSHPASFQEIRDDARRGSAELAASLPSSLVAAARAQGQALTPEAALVQILGQD